MRKLALIAVNLLWSHLILGLQVATAIVFIPWALEPVHAADFSCPPIMPPGSAMPIGDVECLIDAINSANGMTGKHIINLEPGIYTLQVAFFGGNMLPVITSSIRIQPSAEDSPTVIERDPGAPPFRIFEVSIGGELTLDGLTIQRGAGGVGAAILNLGVTSLQNSIVTDSRGIFEGAISNSGTLNVISSIIADNGAPFDGGGIFNDTAGHVLVENSTIAHNGSQGGGGIQNLGSLVIRNSAIIGNATGCCESGGGIGNGGGFVEIVNSTIAKNSVGGGGGSGGAGIANGPGGLVTILNSTIRENEVSGCDMLVCQQGAGINNRDGTVRVQNTIIAGNIINSPFARAPECVGTITSLGNNLVGDPSGCDIKLKPSDLTGAPGLGSLVGAGEDDLPGRTFYPVLAGSPIIDRGNPNACLQTDQLGLLRIGICDIGAIEFRGPMFVSIDVRPRSDANRINPNSSGDINVAILSANGFGATTVDSSPLRFGATGNEAAPVRVVLRDVDGDGDLDMVVRFQIPATGIRCGDTSAILTGQISNGPSIIGSSPIQTVHCKKQK